MKKLIFLTILTLTLATVFTSCKKQPIEPEDPNAELKEMLVGNWEFVSLEFNNNIYTGCDPILSEDYYLTDFDFRDVTLTDFTHYIECGTENGSMHYEYTIVDDVLIWGNNSRQFEIMNIDTFDGTELVLKFISSTLNNVPIGGIYTFQKVQ